MAEKIGDVRSHLSSAGHPAKPLHVNPGGDIEIASWAVYKYMVRICYKFNGDSEKGG